MAIKYFPIEEPAFEMTMNARAYAGPLIEIVLERYESEISLRRQIVATDPAYYHACPYDALDSVWETVELVLTDLAEHHPNHFSLEKMGSRSVWTNRLLGERIEFEIGKAIGDYSSPLDFLGSQIQDDLILMRTALDGEAVCSAGHLCFAAGWCLGDKLGRSFLNIHEEVPLFHEQIGISSDLLLRRLKPGRPVMRCNWTISETDDLNRAPRFKQEYISKGATVTPENAGERCFFRVERQTLSRLPISGAILFTIHTYINTIAEVVEDTVRREMLKGAILTMPATTRRYKSADAYYEALAEYLQRL